VEHVQRGIARRFAATPKWNAGGCALFTLPCMRELDGRLFDVQQGALRACRCRTGWHAARQTRPKPCSATGLRIMETAGAIRCARPSGLFFCLRCAAAVMCPFVCPRHMAALDCACLQIRSLTDAWLQFKNWSLDFASVPQHLKADTNLEEQEGLIRQAQRLCSQLVSLIHTDVLSVKSFSTDSRSATSSTVGIMLTYVFEKRSAC
jgi:hypothetical protein